MPNKWKKEIDKIIGDEPLFTSSMQQNVKKKLQRPIYHKTRSYLFTFTIVVIVSACFLFFIFTYEQSPDRSSNADAELQEELRLANERYDELNTKYEDANQRFEEYLEKYENVYEENFSNKQEVESLQEQVEGLRNKLSEVIFASDSHFLKNQGVMVEEIRESLMERHDLIPYEGILGGTTRFHEDGIYILNANWVFAVFSDGHFGGYMLLKYETKDGEVTGWDVVEAGLPADMDQE